MQELPINQILCGDCKEILANIPSESIDLIYADPPFFSNKNYEYYPDVWKNGVNEYIAWMKLRIKECHRVLKKTGSMYLHCDWHANAHLRILMNKIFGEDKFQNEVIWHYHTGGASRKRFSRSHDTLLFYSKGRKWVFNWKELKFKRTEKALNRARNPKGARILATDIYKIPEDVLEIQQMNPMAKERLDYPTQKPEDLLEAIIKISSNPTEIVLDPFCGSGTSCAVAHKLNRRWIGIDVSSKACSLATKRISKITQPLLTFSKV